jgi:hypothetical protein
MVIVALQSGDFAYLTVHDNSRNSKIRFFMKKGNGQASMRNGNE